MGISIAQLLKLPVLSGAEIVSGSGKSLKRIVDGVTYLESESQVYMENSPLQNELIIIPVSFIELLQTAPVKFIGECYRLKASGICIKTTHQVLNWTDTLHEELKKYAIPIILLPPASSIPQIINSVTYEIFRNDGYDMRLPFEENFFQELICNKKDPTSLVKRAAMMGIKMDEKLGAVLIQPDTPCLIMQILKFCKTEMQQRGYALSKNNRILLVVRVNLIDDIPDRFRSFGNYFYQRLMEEFPSVKFKIGIGRFYDEISQFSTSYYDARIALTAGVINKSTVPVTHFNDLGIYRILFDLKNTKEIYRFYLDTAGIIRDYDEQNKTDYLQTIQIYIAHNCSVNDTAKLMFVHYNTIRYRIKKIQKLFGFDLDNENDRVNLHIAIKVMDFLAENDKF